MEAELENKIIAALLKSIHRQNLISEDTYNHALNYLFKMPDRRTDSCGGKLIKAIKEGGAGGRASD